MPKDPNSFGGPTDELFFTKEESLQLKYSPFLELRGEIGALNREMKDLKDKLDERRSSIRSLMALILKGKTDCKNVYEYERYIAKKLWKKMTLDEMTVEEYRKLRLEHVKPKSRYASKNYLSKS